MSEPLTMIGAEQTETSFLHDTSQILEGVGIPSPKSVPVRKSNSVAVTYTLPAPVPEARPSTVMDVAAHAAGRSFGIHKYNVRPWGSGGDAAG